MESLFISTTPSLLSISSKKRLTTLPPPQCAATMSSSGGQKETKLWGGRFEENVTDAVERFTESISYDKKLYKHDIMGSRAHASMLANQHRIELFQLLVCHLSLLCATYIWRSLCKPLSLHNFTWYKPVPELCNSCDKDDLSFEVCANQLHCCHLADLDIKIFSLRKVGFTTVASCVGFSLLKLQQLIPE